jgi:hypothetical protein
LWTRSLMHRHCPPVCSGFGIFPVDRTFVVLVSAQGSLLCPNGVWDLRVHSRLFAVHIPCRNFASKV